ncbi:MAG: type II toxin-antitoxin system Phd/YefM family antitoxin [Spirochaetaceae bacterium]
MKTISISKLKAHLSKELKEVKKGSSIIVLDHRHPVAMLSPYEEEPLFVREAQQPYSYKELEPLTTVDLLDKMEEEERSDRW